MYNSVIVAEKIKILAIKKRVALKNMLFDCGLNSNTISQLHHNQIIGFDRLAKIADYFDVSVDYLLGRTDKPEINK